MVKSLWLNGSVRTDATFEVIVVHVWWAYAKQVGLLLCICLVCLVGGSCWHAHSAANRYSMHVMHVRNKALLHPRGSQFAHLSHPLRTK